MEKVIMFTDGACSGNPGPGGWCVILRTEKNGQTHEKILSGGERETTNNRMELTAGIKGLEALKRPCGVTETTDSKYVCDAVNKGWLSNWEKNGYMRKNKEIPNADLWKKFSKLISIHSVSFFWIKGHAGHPENEICDKRAVEESHKFN